MAQGTNNDDVVVTATGQLDLSGGGGNDFLVAGATISDGSVFTADINPLNQSGVNGTATLTFDEAADTLTVRISATGLEPGVVHPQHIHGRFADTAEGPGTGEAIDSVSPNLLSDDDGDGFIELAEGLDTYGPIIVPLTSPPGGALEGFPTAPDGTIDFTQTYDLSGADAFADDFDVDDLTPLDFREIVLHGLTVDEGVGAGTPGEVDGAGGFLPTLPVASGEIVAVPEGEILGVRLEGGQGNDTLIGNAGDDFLIGGDDNDTLIGAAGDDTLTGDDDADIFVFSGGNDRITDFNADENDEIVLANGADVGTALDSAVETGDGIALQFDDANSLTLVGVNLDQFGEGDFMVA